MSKDIAIKRTLTKSESRASLFAMPSQENVDAMQSTADIKVIKHRIHEVQGLRLKSQIETSNIGNMTKEVEFDPLLIQVGRNAITQNPSRWIKLTNAIGLITKNSRTDRCHQQCPRPTARTTRQTKEEDRV